MSPLTSSILVALVLSASASVDYASVPGNYATTIYEKPVEVAPEHLVSERVESPVSSTVAPAPQPHVIHIIAAPAKPEPVATKHTVHVLAAPERPLKETKHTVHFVAPPERPTTAAPVPLARQAVVELVPAPAQPSYYSNEHTVHYPAPSRTVRDVEGSGEEGSGEESGEEEEQIDELVQNILLVPAPQQLKQSVHLVAAPIRPKRTVPLVPATIEESSGEEEETTSKPIVHQVVLIPAPERPTGVPEEKKCGVLADCYADEDCNGGKCFGAFVGTCNCNACLNLWPCDNDSACGGLVGACNTTLKHCDCMSAMAHFGYPTLTDSLLRLCNVRQCRGATKGADCFGLPCNVGKCVC